MENIPADILDNKDHILYLNQRLDELSMHMNRVNKEKKRTIDQIHELCAAHHHEYEDGESAIIHSEVNGETYDVCAICGEFLDLD